MRKILYLDDSITALKLMAKTMRGFADLICISIMHTDGWKPCSFEGRGF